MRNLILKITEKCARRIIQRAMFSSFFFLFVGYVFQRELGVPKKVSPVSKYNA